MTWWALQQPKLKFFIKEFDAIKKDVFVIKDLIKEINILISKSYVKIASN